ncbi:MAG: helix-turn-helix transcriptional regulator [Candidatus Binatus sp.]|uniref:AraC family transcriptional regulator n=1 Tax=Candidatus Binatus sp. TaxID=2811406 RepID=UPI003C76B0E6
MPKKRHWFFDCYKYQVRTGTVPEYDDGQVIRTHSHPWHQLVYASQGVMTVRTPEGAWVVPIHRGVWVPAGTRHSIQMSGAVSLRTLYLVPRLGRALPDEPRVIGISPLLRELILRIVELASLSIRVPAHAHLVSVLLDHLHVMQSDAVHLPLPRDARAKRIAAMLQKQPSDTRSLIELSKLAGASKRTVERLFKTETGLGFSKWRQQLRLGHALRLLAAGDAVTTVAFDVGYDSISAFISAFRLTFGKTPGQYFRSA